MLQPTEKTTNWKAGVSLEQIGNLVRSKLDNGFTFVVIPKKNSQVVAIQIWIRAGSTDEPAQKAGLAHMVEHMLFKGTKRWGVGEIPRIIESTGGEINAWTSFDHTVYQVVIPSTYLDVGLEVLADAVQHPSLDPIQLEKEKKVIAEEINRNRNLPARHLGDLLFAQAFGKHPFGHPILGTLKTIKAADPKTVKDFYQKHYQANKMTLVIAGAVEPKQVANKVLSLFGSMESIADTKPKKPIRPMVRQPRFRIQVDDLQQVHIGLAWHIPPANHRDIAALDLMAMVLGQGESSRLVRRLRQEAGLVNDAWSIAYTPTVAGLFVIGVSCPVPSTKKTVELLGRELGLLQTTGVSANELAKVKAMTESDAIYLRETVEGTARSIGYFQALLGEPLFEELYHSRIQSVTNEEIKRIGQTYLSPNSMSAAFLGPKALAKYDKKELIQAFRKGFARATKTTPAKPEKQILRKKFRNGPVVIIEPDQSNPLVAIRAVFLGGSRYENNKNAGINNLLAGLITRGTSNRSAEQIAMQIDEIAGSLDGFSGRNTFGIQAEFPSRYLDQGINITLDCLVNATFAAKQLNRERELVLEAINNREDDLSGMAFDLFSKTHFEVHPYRHSLLGSRKSIGALNRKQLVDYFTKHYQPSRMVLSVVGDVDPPTILNKIQQAFKPQTRTQRPYIAPNIPLDSGKQGLRLAHIESGRSQAHIVLGFDGTSLTNKDRYVLEVLMAVLTGQGGRLFVHLRDELALAYSLTGFSLEGIEPGYLAFYLAVEPNQVQFAVDQLLKQLRQIRQNPVDESELLRAKRYLVGSHAISLQRNAARAAQYAFNELYGLGYLNHRSYSDNIEAVDSTQVLKVAKKYLRLGNYTLAVVGPPQSNPRHWAKNKR